MPGITAEVSEKLFTQLFTRALAKIPPVPFSKPTSPGVLWLGLQARIRVLGCDGIQFEQGNTFLVSELDIGWEELKLTLGLDIPSFEVGGFCVLPLPWGGCIAMKAYTVFPGEPDIGPVTVDLGPLVSFIVSEVSGRFSIDVRKVAGTDPVTDPGRQEIFVRPDDLDVDPIDISGTVKGLDAFLQVGIVGMLTQKLQQVFPVTWIMDLALDVLGLPSLTSLVLNTLDIGDDLQEWLMEVLNESIGLDNLLWDVLFTAVLGDTAVADVEDPYPVKAGHTLNSADYGGFDAPPPALVQIEEVGVPLGAVTVGFDEDILRVTIDLAGI